MDDNIFWTYRVTWQLENHSNEPEKTEAYVKGGSAGCAAIIYSSEPILELWTMANIFWNIWNKLT